MKKSFAFLLVVTLLTSCKKDEDNNTQPNEPAGTPTATGTPLSAELTDTMDALGGTLVSDDGLLEIIVPPGAVNTPTVFGIQRITNHCIGGIGDAYTISPADIQFNTNVSMVYHYQTTTDSLDVSEYFHFAFQNDQSIWMGHPQRAVDTVLKTITLSVNSFNQGRYAQEEDGNKVQAQRRRSTSAFRRIFIVPKSTEIQIGDKELVFLMVAARDLSGYDLAPLVGSAPSTQIPPGMSIQWYKQGVGTLKKFPNDPSSVEYSAPANINNQEEHVTVSAHVRENATSTIKVLHSKIKVYKPIKKYKLLFEYTSDVNGSGVCVIEHGYVDRGTVYFTLNGNALLIDSVTNINPYIASYDALYPGCTATLTDIGNPGRIHITENTVSGTLTTSPGPNGTVLHYVVINAQGTYMEPSFETNCPGNSPITCTPMTAPLPTTYAVGVTLEQLSTHYQNLGTYTTLLIEI